MPQLPSQGSLADPRTRRRVTVIALSVLLVAIVLGLWWVRSRPAPTVVQPVLSHTYTEALEMAHGGKPGAARVLYQQLARTDLSDIRRASLLSELPNYAGPQSMKLLGADLRHPSPMIRQAAIEAGVRLTDGAQRSLLLGPCLDDAEGNVRFTAARALLDLSPDDLGLYYEPLQKVVEQYQQALTDQPPNGQSLLQLARLYVHNEAYGQASKALQQALSLEPNNVQAGIALIDLADRQGQTEQARLLLSQWLERHPKSAQLQYTLGKWLLRHGQNEYALLALTKALELDPENNAYRYDLAVALHDQDQLEAAQKQLAEILQRQPADRRARVLLIGYWKENGQLQKVQVLLAELEQQNPDDPALQQGL
ncbi:tetratricopeptide repeat protein [Pseudomonas sp. Pseusp122]|uniref:tetratricopeptide repeat protein n=1 Tax=unclassified Pseudomonas TaxID=196821 RepID=UPI0039A4F65A